MLNKLLKLFKRLKLPALIGIILLAVLPMYGVSDYLKHLLVVGMLYAVLASNWDLSLGYAGVFNWAHITFFALGAYAAGILSVHFGVSAWLCILFGAIVAALASITICMPVLRVKGIYVCLVTFAFGQLCLHVIMSMSEYTGGSQGLVLIPPITIGNYSFLQDDKIAYYYLALALFIISAVYLRLLVKSKFGLSIIALRDNEDYAISRGVPLGRQRLLTFIASSIMTGATGAVYAFYLGVVSPELFGFGYTATLLSMVLLGGTSTVYGPILGAFVLTFVSEFMVSLGPWRYLIIATIIVVVLLFFPDGALSAFKRLIQVRHRPAIEKRPFGYD